MIDEQREDSRNEDAVKIQYSAKRGRLKIFIGAAPGVGKTYTMLRQAHDLLRSGRRVAIGYIESHERTETAQQIKDLEIIPRKKVTFHSHKFEEMDIDAIIARRPDIVVIDELAHTNIGGGSRFSKRYMDVEFILEEGIDVLTAVNVQHLEEVYTDAEQITGIKVREIIPQSFIERADEIEVVDVPPETMRQRLREGSLYPRGNINQALDHFFKKKNLSALRELALRVVADTVDERFQKSFERMSIPGPVGVKEAILVSTSFLERSGKLIRKGHRLAERMKADLFVLTILDAPENELPPAKKERIGKLKSLADFCHATSIIEQRGDRKIGEVVKDVAERCNVTQIVVGQPRSPRRWLLWKHDPVRYLFSHMKYADLHIIGWKEEEPVLDFIGHVHDAFPAIRGVRPGRLIIYVGCAPGVGKTYKMLQDANSIRSKGTDVVGGLIETHGRKETADQIGSLEILRQRPIEYNGRHYQELDVEGIIRRHPEMVVIDELAHTNVPGSEREKRYLDIAYLLQRGINVVTAVNIQHLESLRDKVEHLTGIKVKERVPDWFMDLAWQIKLIDVTPETLQRRLLRGKIYSKDRIERSINHFFRLGNLSALRELALFEVADDVDQRLERQREKGGRGMRPKSRILVCVNYRPHSEKLIRRGWRIADRHHAELYVLAVLSNDTLTEKEEIDLANMEQLSEQFQAVFLKKKAADYHIGEIITKTAGNLQVEQIVVGQPLPVKNFFSKLKLNPVVYVLRHAEFVNLHVVANSRDEQG